MGKELRPEIVKLAKVAGGITGMAFKIDENAPEYYAFADLLTDDQAKIASAAGLRKNRTVGDLAKRTGFDYEYAKKLAYEDADLGVFRLNYDKDLGEDVFFLNIFAPGILEQMVDKEELLAEHPEIGRAFEDYTKRRMAGVANMMPSGYGFMRVFPVEGSIDHIPDVPETDKISYYMNKYDTFCVSSCSCRSSRQTIDDGCEHLQEDMCLHMGIGAENYIRTGKGREITREEAWEIMRRAEANGLMHDMPNTEEAGESYAICNCCACACFGLRVGLLYGARDVVRSNYVAEIDEAKCVACGQCVSTCPGNALRMGQKLCSTEPIPEPDYRKSREHVVWHKDDWNEDYRNNRKDVVDTGTAPCKSACPAHIAVQGYLKLAAQGRYQDALKLIKKENPFPAVCGRICNHPCEQECTRGGVDEAVAIDEVKRFIADHDLKEETRYIPPMLNQTGKPFKEKIAIIGAGPAGMSCAFYLAQRGYTPTVFEKASKPGGMLVNGIPSFRLERDVVNAEIDILREMGVEFKCGVEVGKDITIQQLREEGYQGFYLAIGMQGGRKVGVPGEDAEGVVTGVEFLYDVNEGAEVALKGDTVVVGGGNVAVDVARTALRVSDRDAAISMVCLETRDIMPAASDEVKEAEEEGITVQNGWGPKEILTKNGKVTGIVFKKCTAVFDAQGRFNPTYDEDDTMTISCSNVLLSIGQSVVWGDLLAGTKVELNRNGTVKADDFTYQTAEPDIFVGGDVYTGAKFAINAIAAGKEGADSLHRWVHKGVTLTAGRVHKNYTSLDKSKALIPMDFDHATREVPGYNKEKERSFGDTRITFTEEQIRKETARCLGCGATKVDEYMCVGCGLCTTRCEFDAIKMKRNPFMERKDGEGVQANKWETMPIHLATDLVKRVGRMGVKAIKKG